MLNLSIITACNNNCDYCFQKNSYHNLGLMLDFNEILNILNWAKGVSTIGILGGEATLHPECVRICSEIQKYFELIFFTNLLCDGVILEQLLQNNSMRWLINTTTRDSYKNLFEENIKYLNRVALLNGFAFCFGITLTGDFEQDEKYIDNLIRLGRKYPYIVGAYRVAFATPCHDKVYRLKNYNKSILRFFEQAKKDTPNAGILFDCAICSCYMSDDVMLKILKDKRVKNASMACATQERLDISADRSVNFCASCPEELFDIKDYRIFDNYYACWSYVKKIKGRYEKQWGETYCKMSKFCTTKTCQGACFASIANLAKQEEKEPKHIQKFNKIRYELMKKLGY